MATVLDLIEESWNMSPQKIIKKGTILGLRELKELLRKYQYMRLEREDSFVSFPGHIKPLYSHHTFGQSSLFGFQVGGNVASRVLKQLLIYDGVVAANPIEDIRLLASRGRERMAVQLLNNVIRDLAVVEPLIQADLLSFTSLRPSLVDARRREFFQVFNIDEKMTVFRNFIEGAAGIDELSNGFERLYRPEVEHLCYLLGLKERVPDTLDECVSLIQGIAADMLEVSWQLAVTSEDPNCDIAIRTLRQENLLRIFAEETIATEVNRSMYKTRHFGKMDMGPVPNVDGNKLSPKDAISVRKYDVFESFRETLHLALDNHKKRVDSNGGIDGDALFEFEEVMSTAARKLQAKMSSVPITSHLSQAGAGATIGFVAGLLSLPDPIHVAVSTATGGASGLIPAWLAARRNIKAERVAIRYYSLLTE